MELEQNGIDIDFWLRGGGDLQRKLPANVITCTSSEEGFEVFTPFPTRGQSTFLEGIFHTTGLV